MARSEYLAVTVIAVIMTVSFQEVLALKCWRCSSDASNAAFCDDPFDESKISDSQRRWSYVECSSNPSIYRNSYQPKSSERAACKKIIQTINDKRVISRSCSWVDENAAKKNATTTICLHT